MDFDKRPQRAVIAVCFYYCVFTAAIVTIYIRGQFWNQPFPTNTFLPGPLTRFGDFFGNHDHWRRLQFNDVSYAGAYFPAIYLLIDIFTSYLAEPYLSLFAFFGSVIGGTVVTLVVWTRRLNLGLNVGWPLCLIVLTSYPMLMTLHTGNIEGWVFLFVMGAVVAIEGGNQQKAAILLGLATAFKFFPIVFVPYILYRIPKSERLRALGAVILSGAASTVIALVALPHGLLEGTNVIQNMIRSQSLYKDLMVVGEPGTNFGHSFLNGVHALYGSSALPSQNFWVVSILILCAFVTLLGIRVDQFRSPWRIATCCASVGCLFAPTSTDYKLLYFLPAIALYLFEPRQSSFSDRFIFVSVLLVIAPKPWFVLGRSEYFNANVWLTPILMLTILSATVFDLFGKASRANF